MKNSKEIARTVFDIRDTYIENKKSKHNRIMSVVKYAAPAAACFGLALTFGINYWSKYSKIPEVEVQPANSVISDSTDTTASDNSKTNSTTVVTSDKNVSATVKAEKSRSDNDNSEEYIGYDSSGEDSVISADEPAVNAEIKDTSVTTAVTQAEGKTTTKKTVVSVTNTPVGTTIVTGTEPAETSSPKPTTDERTEKMRIVKFRFYSKIDDMNHDNYRENLAEMYSVLYEILDSDYMSDEGKEKALTKLHEKELQMNCLFPKVTDTINERIAPNSERLTLEHVLNMVNKSDSFDQLYWDLIGYCPDVLEDFGFSGRREYWLDDYGVEKIVFYPFTREVIYYNYDNETLIYPK